MNTCQKSADTAILVVSFGTRYNSSRDVTIGAVERAIADACPRYQVRRAFTSPTIIRILRERDGLEIDDVTQALRRAAEEGIENLIVQPTHIMDGFEYRGLMEKVDGYKKMFHKISVGMPLLSSEQDFRDVAKAITDESSVYDDGRTAMVFMGHGTEAKANEVYKKLQNILTDEGFDNYYIGTVEASPALGDVAKALREKGIYKKVVLRPLMLVAGDHACNDMAGDGEDSWKTVLLAEGYQVECVLRGIGELKAIRKIYVDHVLAAMEELARA